MLLSVSHAIKQRLRLFPLSAAQSWISRLQMTAADGWSGVWQHHSTSLIPVFKRRRLPQPHKGAEREWWQSQLLCRASFCSAAAVKRAAFCFHVPHFSGPFDDTDLCQDAEALTKLAAWLENSVKAEDSAFCRNIRRERLCVRLYTSQTFGHMQKWLCFQSKSWFLTANSNLKYRYNTLLVLNRTTVNRNSLLKEHLHKHKDAYNPNSTALYVC